MKKTVQQQQHAKTKEEEEEEESFCLWFIKRGKRKSTSRAVSDQMPFG